MAEMRNAAGKVLQMPTMRPANDDTKPPATVTPEAWRLFRVPIDEADREAAVRDAARGLADAGVTAKAVRLRVAEAAESRAPGIDPAGIVEEAIARAEEARQKRAERQKAAGVKEKDATGDLGADVALEAYLRALLESPTWNTDERCIEAIWSPSGAAVKLFINADPRKLQDEAVEIVGSLARVAREAHFAAKMIDLVECLRSWVPQLERTKAANPDETPAVKLAWAIYQAPIRVIGEDGREHTRLLHAFPGLHVAAGVSLQSASKRPRVDGIMHVNFNRAIIWLKGIQDFYGLSSTKLAQILAGPVDKRHPWYGGIDKSGGLHDAGGVWHRIVVAKIPSPGTPEPSGTLRPDEGTREQPSEHAEASGAAK